MQERSYHLHDGKMGAAITVRVTPRARRDKISEILDDGTVKISLTAQSNDEKLNQALIAFLAGVLGVNPKQIEIVAGLSGSDKLVTILGMNKEAVQEQILSHLA